MSIKPVIQFSSTRLSCRLRVQLLVLVAALFMLCTPAKAQLAGKGSITGTVEDSTGAIISGAVVTAKSQSRGITVSQKSTSSGAFTFPALDADVYTVTVVASGFEKLVQENVTVNSLETSNVPAKLQVGSTDTSVTVTGAPPALETSNATLGGTLEQSTYSQLPIQMGAFGQDGARRATDFVALLPGVQFNETNGNATTNTGVVNGGGARGAVSDVYIDGTPFISAAGQGDPRFVWSAISVDAIDQLQVQTLGYSSIYEGQGVQNYTIKSGTNTVHGSIYEYFRNTALDTFNYFDKATGAKDIVTGTLKKPAEHQNEFGGTAGFPVLKNKAFFFGNFNKYFLTRGPTHGYETIPTTAERTGDFSAINQTVGGSTYAVNIYDPASCPAGNNPSTSVFCQRTQFAYNGVKNTIAPTRIAPQAAFMQKFLPAVSNANQINNYLFGHNSGLTNYTGTGRFDYTVNEKQTVSLVFGTGQQQTTGPARQQSVSSTGNAAPAPYISVQQFNPRTTVGMIEHTYVVSPRMLNQFKFGFARYEGSGFNQSYLPQYSATTGGIGGAIAGLPGQVTGAFPKVTFTGTAAPNQWAGYTDNYQATNAYTMVDNYSITKGAHNITVGVQIAWLQYNYQAQSGGSTPLALTFANNQTACYLPAGSTTSTDVGGVPNCPATSTNASINTFTGLPYASFLLGATSSATFTYATVIETGARFRPISPYVQDDWKITPKLTLNIGLRYDYYPSFREVLDRLSYFDPNATNPITGTAGALSYAGTGSATQGFCNCDTNVNNYKKNFGPRLGFAYAIAPKTVIRSSYGVIYAHGGGTGGSAISRQGTGFTGYSATPSYTSASASLPAFYLQDGVPSFQVPPFFSAAYGTGYTTNPNYVTPQTLSYSDPYYGDRAPQFINWSFGIQQAFARDLTLTATYVGSQGHFLQPDSQNGRGYWTNKLDPQYLALGSTVLSGKATAANLAAIGKSLPYPTFLTSRTVAQALVPFAQYNGISDAYGNVANSNYHALQTSLVRRFNNGNSFMVNYTWARNIDDAGTFRSGYDLPASATANGLAYKANRLDRSLSLADRRHNLVATGVFSSPFGQSLFAGNRPVKSILGNFRLSTIFTAFTGSPLAVTSATSNTNPSQSQAMPSANPSFTGNIRPRGWSTKGLTSDTVSSTAFIDSTAFQQTPDYKFSVLARTAPFGLIGPGNYNLDLSLRRVFTMPHYELLRLTVEADMYNVFNHVQLGGINTSYGNGAFGSPTATANQQRDVQLAARIDF